MYLYPSYLAILFMLLPTIYLLFLSICLCRSACVSLTFFHSIWDFRSESKYVLDASETFPRCYSFIWYSDIFSLLLLLLLLRLRFLQAADEKNEKTRWISSSARYLRRTPLHWLTNRKQQPSRQDLQFVFISTHTHTHRQSNTRPSLS